MIASTRKGTSVYLHLLKPEITGIHIPYMAAKIKTITAPGGEHVIAVNTEPGWSLSIPPRTANTADTVLEITLDRPAGTLPAMDLPAPSVETKPKAGAASSDSNRPQVAVYYFPNYHPGDPRNSRMKGKSGLNGSW